MFCKNGLAFCVATKFDVLRCVLFFYGAIYLTLNLPKTIDKV